LTVTDPYPRRFGRYVLVDQLARGGMGELHLAVTGDENVQRLCVVKQVLRHLTDLEHTQRFLDEVMVMARLSHGNLVPVLESGVVEGQYFLAMDFVDGKNLREAWNTLTANEHRNYLGKRAAYYRQEARWPDAPFWSRRRAEADAVPA